MCIFHLPVQDAQFGPSSAPSDVPQLQHDRQYAVSSFCGAPVMMLEDEAPCHSGIPQVQHSYHISVHPEVAIATSPARRSSSNSLDPMHGGHTFLGGATSSPGSTSHRPSINHHQQTSSGGSHVLDSEIEDVWMLHDEPHVYGDARNHGGDAPADSWQHTQCRLADGSASPGGRKHPYQPSADESRPHGGAYCQMPAGAWTYHPSELRHLRDASIHRHDDMHHSPEAPWGYQNPEDHDAHGDGHTLEAAWAYQNAHDEADEPHHHLHDNDDTHDGGHTPDGWPSASFESPLADGQLPSREQQPQAHQHPEEQHRFYYEGNAHGHTESPVDVWPMPFERPLGDDTDIPSGSSSRQHTHHTVQTQQDSSQPREVVIRTAPYHVPGLENLHDEISPACHAEQPGGFEDAVEKVCCEFDVFNQASECYHSSTGTGHVTSGPLLHDHHHSPSSAMRVPQLSLSPPQAAEDMDADFSSQQHQYDAPGGRLGRNIAEEPCWPSSFPCQILKRRYPHEPDFPTTGMEPVAQQPVKVKRARRSKKKKLPAHVALLKTVKKYIHQES